MDIRLQPGSLAECQTPLLAVGVAQDEPLPPAVAALFEPEDFHGEAGEQLLLYPRGALAGQRLLLLGLGAPNAINAETLRQAGARAARKAHDLQLDTFSLLLPSSLPPALAAQALAEGAILGAYHYLEQKSSLTPKEEQQPETLLLLARPDMPSEVLEAARQGAALGQVVARGVVRARNLANTPGNLLTPARLGTLAEEIGAQVGQRVVVLGPEELVEQGFGGLLAVGQGSAQSPRFIIMEHGTSTPDTPTICLVGKGVTFDTGGISIKPAQHMDQMKMDMGGAAAVIGAMQVAGELRLPLRLIGLISAAENMPGANAYKPGDVIVTLSGKTVEVLNTDAEGRIVLADALFYAQRYQPDAIIDLATLTGAIVVALGAHASGLLSNHQTLADRLLQAGTASGERIWQLPLWDEYREAMKSDVADLKNVAGRNGGAINAAAFLSAFVGDYPWAHVDIAGTAWVEEKPRPYQTPGATGVGVRLVIAALQGWRKLGATT